jgi:hypothetical protein
MFLRMIGIMENLIQSGNNAAAMFIREEYDSIWFTDTQKLGYEMGWKMHLVFATYHILALS